MILARIGIICCMLGHSVLAARSGTRSSQPPASTSSASPPTTYPNWNYVQSTCFEQSPLTLSRPNMKISPARYSDCVQALMKIQASKVPLSYTHKPPDGYRNAHLWESGTCSVAAGIFINSLEWPDAQILYEATEVALRLLGICVIDSDPAAPAGGGRQGLGGTILLTSSDHGGAGLSMVLRGRLWPKSEGPDPGWPRHFFRGIYMDGHPSNSDKDGSGSSSTT